MSKRIKSGKHNHQNSHRCACGKSRYRDKTEAVEVLHRIQNNANYSKQEYGATHRNEIRSYLCGICNGWHLTSTPLGGSATEWKLAA